MIGPLGVSNLAWPPDMLDSALALLARLGCGAVEIAPWAVFGRWESIAEDARRLRDRIEAHGLICTALQGILFGAGDVSLFGAPQAQANLQRHLERVAELAGLLGARACVFGAPRQRDPGTLDADAAWQSALHTLRRVGPAFAAAGSALAFEANAQHYACRFVTTTSEAMRLVEAAATPGIGLQIDTGTIFLEHEPPDVLLRAAPVAVHAHVSEPDLQPIGGGLVDHAPIAAALQASGYAGSLSVEMRQTDDWIDAVIRAVAFVEATYR
jgi:sugar phosphate isomerase/epimerase